MITINVWLFALICVLALPMAFLMLAFLIYLIVAMASLVIQSAVMGTKGGSGNEDRR